MPKFLPIGLKKSLFRLSFLSGCLALPISAGADVTLVFGTYAADKPTEIVRQFKPFLSFMETELSAKLDEPVKIKMRISKAYEDSIDQLATGDVDFSRFGPASYVVVQKKNPSVSLIAMESKNGKKTFKGVIAIHKDSPIKELSELNNQTFAFGDELSTIGRYLAQSELLEVGISSSELVNFQYLGRHDLVGTSVGNRNFDAGALKESTFKKLVKDGVPIKALATFDNITKPWIASSKIEPRVLEAMRAIMLDPKNLEAMKSIAKNGFLEGSDTDYDPIRKAMNRSKNF